LAVSSPMPRSPRTPTTVGVPPGRRSPAILTRGPRERMHFSKMTGSTGLASGRARAALSARAGPVGRPRRLDKTALVCQMCRPTPKSMRIPLADRPRIVHNHRRRGWSHLAGCSGEPPGTCSMSLFGKFLAFLNLLGVIGRGCLAALDYGKRKSWAYSVFLHERAVHGLPLDENDTDAEGRRLVDKLGEQTLRDLFAQAGGSPVRTQVEEVQRVKDQLGSKVGAAGDNVKQIVALSRILAPLADSPRERERHLAYRTHLTDPEALARLKGRVQAAFLAAARPPAAGETPAPFEKAFREALRQQAALQAVGKQGSEPAEAIVVAFLRALPEGDAEARAANFEDTWNKALETQR